MSRIAIIAGSGSLPRRLMEAFPGPERPVFAHMEGMVAHAPSGAEVFRIERLALFMDRLHDLGVDRVVFAGAVQRPRLDPERFDPRTAMIVPRMLSAMQQGDDATLREVIAIFEEDGFVVIGAHALVPDLVPVAGVLSRSEPDAQARADTERAAGIAAALGAVDVGQGAVVAKGLCLAVEALPGTDAMLAQVAALGAMKPTGAGVLYKAPKAGQDRRVDLPAIGPETVRNAAAAGLAGIAFEAGGVMLLDGAEAVIEANRLGLFLWARDPVE